MYFVLKLITAIIIVTFIITQVFNILTEKTTEKYQVYFNLVIYIIFICTIITIIINIVMFVKTKNKTGVIGDPGIEGPQGKQGKKGKCNTKCGRKICYIDVVDYANKIYGEDIKNKEFLNKINKICNSDQYFDTITTKHPKKPTEFKLIKYIKETIKDWVEEISKNDIGKNYLSQPHLKIDVTLPEIYKNFKKYDIWKWGDEPLIKKLNIKIKRNNFAEPKPDQARLYIQKSNNYEKTYDSEVRNDEWDIEFCPYNQLGVKRDNPNKLDKCIYIDPVKFTKEYKPTWKNRVFNKSEELSLYNPITYKDDNKILFYPVGGVWSGKNSEKRNPYSHKSPYSRSKCGDGHGLSKDQKYNDIGPIKETILVSGDITKPKDYVKIWDSKKKCGECQSSEKYVQIFRPIPQDGYTCLGDVSIKYIKDDTEIGKKNQRKVLDNLNIRCIPTECVQKKKIGPRVWSNKDIDYRIYKDYLSYTSRKPYYFNKQLNASLWDAGNSNSGEEIKNRYGIQLDENGGYNLYRASRDHNLKPNDSSGNKLDTYIINEKCLLPANGKTPKKYEYKTLKPGFSTEKNEYNTKQYFGKKTQEAILTNIDESFDNTPDKNIKCPLFKSLTHSQDDPPRDGSNQPKRFYLIDDGTKLVKDNPSKDEKQHNTFFIKTYNQDKNDFSSCLKINIESGEKGDEIPETKVEETPYCRLNDEKYRWVVEVDLNINKITKDGSESEVKTNNLKVIIRPYLMSHKVNKQEQYYYLQNYYDKHGINHSILTKDDSGSGTNPNNWLFQTFYDKDDGWEGQGMTGDQNKYLN